MIDKSKVACFSGHRKLPENFEELRKSLEAAITELICWRKKPLFR